MTKYTLTATDTYGIVASENRVYIKRYYIYDGEGNVAQLSKADGTMERIYEYDAFGNDRKVPGISSTDTSGNVFKYRGEYYDQYMSGYYLRARYYTPANGRFTQEDTHWNVGNMVYTENGSVSIEAIFQSGNLYAYCMGNPIRYIDESGEFINTLIGGALGAGFGALTSLFTGKDVKIGAISGLVGGMLQGLGADLAACGLGFMAPIMAIIGSVTGKVIEIGMTDPSVKWGSATVIQEIVVAAIFGVVFNAFGSSLGRMAGMDVTMPKDFSLIKKMLHLINFSVAEVRNSALVSAILSRVTSTYQLVPDIILAAIEEK